MLALSSHASSFPLDLPSLVRAGSLFGLVLPRHLSLSCSFKGLALASLSDSVAPGPTVKDVLSRSRMRICGPVLREGDWVAVEAALEWSGLSAHKDRSAAALCAKNQRRLQFAAAVVRVWDADPASLRGVIVDLRGGDHDPLLPALCRELILENFAVLALFATETQSHAWHPAHVFRWDGGQVVRVDQPSWPSLWRQFLVRWMRQRLVPLDRKTTSNPV